MKIFIVSHYWDNGESYEDYRTFEKHFHYSTLELAESKFFEEVTSDYEGEWVLSSKVLDTQEENTIEKSSWQKCSPQWDELAYCYIEEEEPCYEPDPQSSIQDAFDAYEEDRYCEYLDEEAEIEEYLKEPHENYEVFKQLEEDALNSLNAALDEVLNNN